jgi:hypothetical protein
MIQVSDITDLKTRGRHFDYLVTILVSAINEHHRVNEVRKRSKNSYEKYVYSILEFTSSF